MGATLTVGWVLYAMSTTLLGGVVAVAAEGILRAGGRQARGAWVIAVTGGLLVSVLALPRVSPEVDVRAVPASDAGSPAAVGPLSRSGAGTEMVVPGVRVGIPGDLRFLTRPIPWGGVVWTGLSVALLALAGLQAILLHGRRGRWRRQHHGGRELLVSSSVGPAALGLLRPEVVLPRWVLRDLTDEQIALVVRHEEEHLRAGDVPMLAGLGLVVAAMPWNLPLWWCAGRLRQAVELDCDARVLRGGADPSSYGRLLLDVAGRGRPWPFPVAALGEVRRLEARIRCLRRGTASRTRRAAAALLGAAAVVAACELPTPPALQRTVVETGGVDGMILAEASPSDRRGWMDAVGELARAPEIRGAEGVLALLLPDGFASGSGDAVIHGAVGTSLPNRAVDAVVQALAASTLEASGGPPGAWVPVWVLLARDRVEVHAVRPELYAEKRFLTDRQGLQRHMAVFRRLESRFLGGMRLSHAMSAADRPGDAGWPSVSRVPYDGGGGSTEPAR